MILEINSRRIHSAQQLDQIYNCITGMIVVIFILLCTSCNQQKSKAEYLHLKGNAQGTTFSIVYADSLERDFSKPIDSIFRLIDKSMSLWDSTSIISMINANQDSVADIHFQNVFKRSVYYSELTEGAFDMTVGPLAKRWGFHYKKNQPPPDSVEIKNLLECVGWTKVFLRDNIVNKSNPCIQIDFNAIAQGYTVDVLSEFLVLHDIQNYMIELGGEVRASGANESKMSWKIGIDKPIPENEIPENNRPLQKIISLHNKSLATSGGYRKYILIDGKKFSHTINPKTGYPIHQNLLSVSVLADNCMDADALATCFMVMGLDKSLEMAKKWGISIYCIYENTEGVLTETILGDWD